MLAGVGDRSADEAGTAVRRDEGTTVRCEGGGGGCVVDEECWLRIFPDLKFVVRRIASGFIASLSAANSLSTFNLASLPAGVRPT